MKFKLNLLLLGLLFFLLLIFYKYNEWVVVYKTNELNNSLFSNYTSLNEKDSIFGDELALASDELATKSASKNENIAKNSWYDFWAKMNPIINLSMNNNEKIILLFENAEKQNEIIKKRNNLLILSKTKAVIKNYSSEMDNYISSNLQIAKHDKATGYFLSAYAVVQGDMKILEDFENGPYGENLDEIIEYVYQNFYQISSLEKYSKDGYKFDNEDFIKENLPDSYEYLVKIKHFFNSYYAMTKDMAAKDKESAQYKWNKFNNSKVDLNIDVFSMDEKESKERTELLKKALESEQNIIASLKSLASIKINYPILKTDFSWSDEMIKCDAMINGSTIFNSLTGKYVESDNFNMLNEELVSKGIMSAKYEYDDEFFNLENSEKLLQFTCTDPLSNSAYIIRTHK